MLSSVYSEIRQNVSNSVAIGSINEYNNVYRLFFSWEQKSPLVGLSMRGWASCYSLTVLANLLTDHPGKSQASSCFKGKIRSWSRVKSLTISVNKSCVIIFLLCQPIFVLCFDSFSALFSNFRGVKIFNCIIKRLKVSPLSERIVSCERWMQWKMGETGVAVSFHRGEVTVSFHRGEVTGRG